MDVDEAYLKIKLNYLKTRIKEERMTMFLRQMATSTVFCLMHLKGALIIENFCKGLTRGTFQVKLVLVDTQIQAKCYQVISQVSVASQYFLIMDLMLRWTSISTTKI